MTKHKIEDDLNNWAKENDKNAALRIAKMMLKRVFNTTQNLEQFSTWLLIGSAAAVGLIISNLTDIKSLISATGLFYCLYFLAASVTSGAIAKYLSLIIKNAQSIIHSFEEELYDILELYEKQSDEINEISASNGIMINSNINKILEEALEHYIEPFPSYLKSLTKIGFEKGKQDPIFAYKKIVKQVVLLAQIIFLQAIFTIASILCIAYNIN